MKFESKYFPNTNFDAKQLFKIPTNELPEINVPDEYDNELSVEYVTEYIEDWPWHHGYYHGQGKITLHKHTSKYVLLKPLAKLFDFIINKISSVYDHELTHRYNEKVKYTIENSRIKFNFLEQIAIDIINETSAGMIGQLTNRGKLNKTNVKFALAFQNLIDLKVFGRHDKQFKRHAFHTLKDNELGYFDREQVFHRPKDKSIIYNTEFNYPHLMSVMRKKCVFNGECFLDYMSQNQIESMMNTIVKKAKKIADIAMDNLLKLQKKPDYSKYKPVIEKADWVYPSAHEWHETQKQADV